LICEVRRIGQPVRNQRKETVFASICGHVLI
jgi:hypothetical protein